MELKGKRILVMGMASSGLAAALFLRARGARVVVSEMRAAGELRQAIPGLLAAGVAIETGGHRERSFLDAELIVVSPGVPADHPLLERARAERIPVWSEIELAWRFLRGATVAITGANGKTTTTTLTAELIAACGGEVQVGGNIGTPLVSLVESSSEATVNVVEVSSFQLETTDQFRPRYAAVLNLSPDHLDRHGSMEGYAAAKQLIFRNQQAEDFAVLNADDEWCRRFAASCAGRVAWFSAQGLAAGQEGATVQDGRVVWRWGGREFPLFAAAEIPLRGAHNVENVLAAVGLACLAQGTSPEARAAIAGAVRGFRAVEHRLEFVARVGGVDYYNDSKATNVDATLKALSAFPGGVWAILGGKDKGSDYAPLAPLLRERARGVLLIGAAGEKIAAHLAAGLAESPVRLQRCGTLARALNTAAAQAQPGDTVLLAPACASFDQFENFAQRGRAFKELVRALAAKPA